MVKWITLENETGERVLKQHGIVHRICREKYTGIPYSGNVSLCKKLAVSDDGEKSIPWSDVESEPLNKETSCKICLKVFKKL